MKFSKAKIDEFENKASKFSSNEEMLQYVKDNEGKLTIEDYESIRKFRKNQRKDTDKDTD